MLPVYALYLYRFLVSSFISKRPYISTRSFSSGVWSTLGVLSVSRIGRIDSYVVYERTLLLRAFSRRATLPVRFERFLCRRSLTPLTDWKRGSKANTIPYRCQCTLHVQKRRVSKQNLLLVNSWARQQLQASILRYQPALRCYRFFVI